MESIRADDFGRACMTIRILAYNLSTTTACLQRRRPIRRPLGDGSWQRIQRRDTGRRLEEYPSGRAIHRSPHRDEQGKFWTG